MDFFDYFHNRFYVPPFVINSMPKAGTNLLAKAVSLFPAIHWKRGYIVGYVNVFQLVRSMISGNSRRRAHIGYSALDLLTLNTNSEEACVQIGIDRPRAVPVHTLRNAFLRINNGSFATGHIPYSTSMANLFKEAGVHTLLILRDPRDVVISHSNYVSNNPNHFLFATYQELSKSERIMQSIIGINGESYESPKLLNIDERYRSILPWRLFDWNYTTYFERLVGPKGNGSNHDQIEELKNISYHLNIKYSTKDFLRIANQLHGGTSTFRKGKIGNWRNYFTEEHKHAFKDVTRHLIIELGYEHDNNW